MKHQGIGTVSAPMDKPNVQPFINLVNILLEIDPKAEIIGVQGDCPDLKSRVDSENYTVIKHRQGKNPLYRVINYLATQLRISKNLLLFSKNVHHWFFFQGESQILPLISAKMLGKKTYLIIGGQREKEIEILGDFIAKPLKFFKKMNLALADHIVLYSPRLVGEWGFTNYERKIIIAPRHYIDVSEFSVQKPFPHRNRINVGFIGRFWEGKGIFEFVNAIPIILKEHAELSFFIGGDGILRDEIHNMIQELGLCERVNVSSWIEHEHLPDYLNELSILVIPSYTEGLPNIMLEAMSCGTIVLATAVGSIPDIITDGETGFLMENPSAECIAEGVTRILCNTDLDAVSSNARKCITDNFTFDKAVERYTNLLNNQTT